MYKSAHPTVIRQRATSISAPQRHGDCLRSKHCPPAGEVERALLGRFEYAERGILDRTDLHFFTLASFRRFNAEAKSKVEEPVATPAPLLVLVPKPYRAGWLRLLHRLNAALARSWKSLFGYQFVAVARRMRIP